MDLYSIVGEMGGGSFSGQEKGASPIEALRKWLENLDPVAVIATGIETDPVISKLQQESGDIEIEKLYQNMWKISVPENSGDKVYLYTVVKTVEE